jgi:hypothetical protein
MNSAIVEFEDGHTEVISRNALRKVSGEPDVHRDGMEKKGRADSIPGE